MYINYEFMINVVIYLENVLLHHEGVRRSESTHVAQVQLRAGVHLAVVAAQLALLQGDIIETECV